MYYLCESNISILSNFSNFVLNSDESFYFVEMYKYPYRSYVLYFACSIATLLRCLLFSAVICGKGSYSTLHG